MYKYTLSLVYKGLRTNQYQTKSFNDLIKTKLSQKQLDEIERQAQLEVDILRSIQKVLSDTMAAYMQKK